MLTWLFLESPRALGILLGILLFGLLVHWRRSLNPKPLLIGLGLAAALLLIQNAVVTQREHAGLILDAIQADLLASRPDAIERSLADPFTAGQMDRSDFLQVVRSQLRRVRILQLSRSGLERTGGDDDAFQVEAAFNSRIDTTEFGALPMPTRWAMDFVKTPEGWRIRRIEPLMLGGQPHTTWATYGGR